MGVVTARHTEADRVSVGRLEGVREAVVGVQYSVTCMGEAIKHIHISVKVTLSLYTLVQYT